MGTPLMRGRRGVAGLARVLCAALLASCAPAATPTAAPAPVPRVAVTPWHAPRVLGWAQAYQEIVGPLPFDLEVVHATVAVDGVRQGTYALAIGSFTPAEGWYATPLGEEPIDLVTGSGTGARQLTQPQLASLLAGRTTNWSAIGGNDRPVLPIIPLPGDDVRAFVETLLMQGSGFASAARLVASPEQGVTVLEADAGGLLLLPESAVPPDLAPLLIDRLSASDEAYPYRAPRVALALTEPGGAIRDWLVWIQTEQLAASD